MEIQLQTADFWKLDFKFQSPTSGGWRLEIGNPISNFRNLDFNFQLLPRNFQLPEVGGRKFQVGNGGLVFISGPQQQLLFELRPTPACGFTT